MLISSCISFIYSWFIHWLCTNLYFSCGTYCSQPNLNTPYMNARKDSRNALYRALWHTWEAMPSIQVGTSSWLLIYLVLAIDFCLYNYYKYRNMIWSKLKREGWEKWRENWYLSQTEARQLLHHIKVLLKDLPI
jgi:hypothetical protein